jgi:SH3-like domain-containing protein
LGLVLVAGAAEAAPGTTRTTTIVHKSASSSSSVIAALKKGTYVFVVKCTAFWCQVHRSGLDGWVLRSAIYNPYYGSKRYYQFPPFTPVPGRTNRSSLR